MPFENGNINLFDGGTLNLFDAQQVAMGFLMPNYLRLETTVYETKYPSFDYASVVPVLTEGDEWGIGVMFASSDIAGRAEWWNGKAFDMPYADVTRNWGMHTFEMAAIGYEWTLPEVRQAAIFGRDLGAEKANGARRVAEQFLFNVCMSGSTEKGMTGVINSPIVPQVTVPADGTGSSTTWATKTPDQIIRDFNNGLIGVMSATQETEMADTVLMPFTQFSYLATTPRSGSSDTTIMQWLMENNVYRQQTGQALTIRSLRTLVGAGSGGTNRAVFYRRSPDVLRFHLPMPHRFLPPWQKSSTTWEVAGIMRTGGVEIRLPQAIRYVDGI